MQSSVFGEKKKWAPRAGGELTYIGRHHWFVHMQMRTPNPPSLIGADWSE